MKHRAKSGAKSTAAATGNKTKTTKDYSLVISLSKKGPVLREVALCQRTDTVNKTGGLITSSSQAELADIKTIKKLSKKLGLTYRQFPTQYHLRFDQAGRLTSGYRNNFRKASQPLSERQLNKLAEKLQCRRK